MMICLGSLPGAGKSAAVMSIFVMSLFRNWLININNNDYPAIEWDIFSLERSALHTRCKMIAWILTSNYGIQVSVEDLLSWKEDNIINPELLPYLPQMLRYLDYLEDKIKINEGERTPDDIISIIQDKMNRIGKNIYSVMTRNEWTGSISGDIYVDLEKVASFDNETFEVNEFGTKRYYKDIIVNEEIVRVYENDRFYIPNDKKKINLWIIDHLSKAMLALKPNGQLMNRKETNDYLADGLAAARDYYKLTVIIVNQFNREIYRLDPTSFPMGVVPSETHFADSSSVIRNADLVIGMINPQRLNDWQHQGFNVEEDFISDDGYCTLRTLFIIKSTYGGDGACIPMNFLGKSGFFRTIPKAAYITPEIAHMCKYGLFEHNGMPFNSYFQ